MFAAAAAAVTAGGAVAGELLATNCSWSTVPAVLAMVLLLLLACLAGVGALLPCALLLLVLLLLRNGSEASAATSVTGKEALRDADTRCALEPEATLLMPLLPLLPLLVSLPLAYPLSEPLTVAVGGGVAGYELLLPLLLLVLAAAVVAFTRFSGELSWCFSWRPGVSADCTAATAAPGRLCPKWPCGRAEIRLTLCPG